MRRFKLMIESFIKITINIYKWLFVKSFTTHFGKVSALELCYLSATGAVSGGLCFLPGQAMKGGLNKISKVTVN